MTNFPRVELASRVDPADQASAIEFVNRVNWLFETWNVEVMMQAFTSDSVIYHFLGTVRTPEEKKHFVESVYPYLIPGVSRLATNHIVDVDGDGVAVRYHDLSIRYAEVEKAANLGDGEEQESHIGLPALWTYSPVLDRLRRVDGQWRIAERHIGGSMTDPRFSPPTKDAQALAAFMPQAPSSRDKIAS